MWKPLLAIANSYYWCIFSSISALLWLLPVWNYVTQHNGQVVKVGQSFNYIIVGGGTSGCILAAQLSAISNISVLLLEAGSSKPALFDIPALGPALQMSPLDWQYLTVPQNHSCGALHEQRSRWPLGKALGGTTHLNYMIHLPGHLDDLMSSFNNYWTEADVRHYLQFATKAVPLAEGAFSTRLTEALKMAAHEKSIPWEPHNMHTTSAFYHPSITMDVNGRRWSADKLVKEILHRPNLFIKTGVVVHRILINRQSKAYGVELLEGSERKVVFATREVILTAGTVNSAHLLMLSGVGPTTVLANAKIPIVRDLPVGQNLQDHVTTGLDLILSDQPIFGLSDLTSPLAAFQYFAYGRGPYTSGLCEAIGLFPANSTEFSRARRSPSIQLMAMMAGASSDGGLMSRYALGIKDEIWNAYWTPLLGKQTVSILPVLLHPRSVGQVVLDSSNPSDQPLVDPQYLSHPDDVDVLVEGLQLVYNITVSTSMRNMGFRLNRRLFPGCERSGVFGSKDYWRCYVRQFTLTSYHPVGTCSLGSVLDAQLRVRGIDGLRVADASVMTSLPGGNPHAAVMLIAYKAADLIVSDWYNFSSMCLFIHIFIPPRICSLHS